MKPILLFFNLVQYQSIQTKYIERSSITLVTEVSSNGCFPLCGTRDEHKYTLSVVERHTGPWDKSVSRQLACEVPTRRRRHTQLKIIVVTQSFTFEMMSAQKTLHVLLACTRTRDVISITSWRHHQIIIVHKLRHVNMNIAHQLSNPFWLHLDHLV